MSAQGAEDSFELDGGADIGDSQRSKGMNDQLEGLRGQIEELRDLLAGLTDRIEEVKRRVEDMKNEQQRGGVRAVYFSLLSLLLGLLVDLFKS
ncbi:hypothetical protein ACFV3F_43935 [Streptomyces sp. NPDC059717]|uniref:hypothetical protein n=1 Tax=Streptomyces sp. NPDC059717 TaxID=3346922 RepID=UPI0036AFF26F